MSRSCWDCHGDERTRVPHEHTAPAADAAPVKLAEPVTSYMACGDSFVGVAPVESGTAVTCPRHGEQETVIRAQAEAHRSHAFGEYEFCPLCRYDKRIEMAGADRARDARIGLRVAALPAALRGAYASVTEAQGVLAGLVEDYDVELVESPDADDLAHELGVAERALRNAGRIAEHRAALDAGQRWAELRAFLDRKMAECDQVRSRPLTEEASVKEAARAGAYTKARTRMAELEG